MEKEKQVETTKETDAEKIERIEKALAEKDETIKQQASEIENLNKKINSIRIDGLVKQVEPKVVKEQEDVVFDFDL